MSKHSQPGDHAERVGLLAGVGASAILGLGEAIGRMFSSPSGAIGSASPNDPAGHLLRQSRGSELAQEQFIWDAAGNLLADSPDKSAGMVEGNRLKVWRDIRFEYGPWGNVSHKRKGSRLSQRFSFDAEDRLDSVMTEDAHGVVETRFEYDPVGRRIARLPGDRFWKPVGQDTMSARVAPPTACRRML